MTILIKPLKDSWWFAAAALLLIAATWLNMRFLLDIWGIGLHDESPQRGYSYIESDFPPYIISLSKHPYSARLTVEDSVHYEYTDDDEWKSMFPAGGGFVRLGPDHRMFGIPMFHQLHCLDKMRRAIIAEPRTDWEKSHTQHCLNYIRQMVLCALSLRLENVKESNRGLKVDGLGLEHQCRDWSVLYELTEKNHRDWPEDVYP